MDPVTILVVDDDQDKLRRVLNCLEAVPGCLAEHIHSARDANEARRYLRENKYDLMVLDIALPDRPDSFPMHDGGIRLLEEILDRDIYKRPREVVGLTAFADVLESAGKRFAEDLWLVIHYDPATDNWARQLQKKIRYIQLAKRATPLPAFKTYACVVTALPFPEMSAVLKIPWGWEKVEVSVDPTTYYRGLFLKDGSQCEIIAASSPRMGLTPAAVLSMKMIREFRPRYLAIVGILAGIRAVCSLGDIVAADPVWDWGSGKFIENGDVHEFAPSPYQVSVNSFVRSKLAELANSDSALDEIRRGWQGPRPKTILRMHIGPVASGASVLADQEVSQTVRDQHRKLVGIDMESYAVFAAAEESPLPQPKAFSIKSVCDFADSEKGDGAQEYASYTSATALRFFMERYL